MQYVVLSTRRKFRVGFLLRAVLPCFQIAGESRCLGFRFFLPHADPRTIMKRTVCKFFLYLPLIPASPASAIHYVLEQPGAAGPIDEDSFGTACLSTIRLL
ncbi:hypothetical protein M407DRAFT_105960 [Tulasnella calospora MUT 4182]|uniref:Uncharacterized protein n=1 Tax=Tulasnella calospora MUT 4182 TaxID=1051891 RepID=A0A0C3LRG4_9AGAM|nr:hypothetical protein M407DRAFT_105960 [Tulasnella calospora MUT 4182]